MELYSNLGAMVVYVALFALVWLSRSRSARRKAELGELDVEVDHAVLMPVFLPVLAGGLLASATQFGTMNVVASLCNSTFVDTLPGSADMTWVNSVLSAVNWLAFDWYSFGVAFLFLQQSVVGSSLRRSLLLGLGLSLVTTTLQVIGINYRYFGQPPKFDTALDLVQWALPIAVLFVPMLLRSDVRPSATLFLCYSVLWRICYIAAEAFE